MVSKEYLESKLARLENKRLSTYNLKNRVSFLAFVVFTVLLLVSLFTRDKVYLQALIWVIGFVAIIQLTPSLYMSAEGWYIHQLASKYHPEDIPTIRRIYEKLAFIPFAKTYLEEGYFVVFLDKEEFDTWYRERLSITTVICWIMMDANLFIKELDLVTVAPNGKKALAVLIKPITDSADYRGYFTKDDLAKIKPIASELDPPGAGIWSED